MTDIDKLIGRYQIVLSELSADDGGGFLATVPDLPGCMADGETVGEAAEEARDAIRAYLNAFEEEGKEFPAPARQTATDDVSGKFQVRLPKSLHAKLKRMAEEEDVSLNQLMNVLVAESVTRRAA